MPKRTWFHNLCRNTGLALHEVIKPLPNTTKQELKRETEEKQINETMILRRTTIEEIEIRNDKQ